MKRAKSQVVVSIASGSEPWVIVRHASGWFKLPADASCLELVTGALEGWSGTRRRTRGAEATVRVPLSKAIAAGLL